MKGRGAGSAVDSCYVSKGAMLIPIRNGKTIFFEIPQYPAMGEVSPKASLKPARMAVLYRVSKLLRVRTQRSVTEDTERVNPWTPLRKNTLEGRENLKERMNPGNELRRATFADLARVGTRSKINPPQSNLRITPDKESFVQTVVVGNTLQRMDDCKHLGRVGRHVAELTTEGWAITNLVGAVSLSVAALGWAVIGTTAVELNNLVGRL